MNDSRHFRLPSSIRGILLVTLGVTFGACGAPTVGDGMALVPGAGGSGLPAGGAPAGGGGAASGGLASGGAVGSGGVDSSAGGAGELPTTGGAAASGGESAGGAAGGSLGAGGTADGAGGSPIVCPPAGQLHAGETTKNITVGTLDRTYLQHIPTGYQGDKPVPVVIDFHPLGGTGSSQKGLSGWGTKADSEGFIVIWPNGIGNSWNVGRCCDAAMQQEVDDVAFVRAIIAELQKEACVDTTRIYATGCSNGGGMSYKIACDAGDLIAAIAPVDFDCVYSDGVSDSCGGCEPGRPLSEIQFRATNDSAVPYGGGNGPKGTPFPGAEQNFSDWAELNTCTGEPAALEGNASCEAYPVCKGGVETVLCTQQGGSHCGNYAALHIVDTAWALFERQSL